MKLKNKIIVLLIGALLILAGLNLILDSAATKNLGTILALTGVSVDIVILLLFIKQEKWLSKI
ncbi:hypothetical protein SAMN04487995_5057 [Dyadobacter koreensis]|uniref:Uncharacterized protein n=1 Tax=Dyadobacter koreensis TaxID=408657 RepID=A0A1H6ZA91_9BACT|nr:hypothetical protein [Dyadobacter koreensis]SEJ50349.1 hypothetical protein SAMN04487995_5057 [Dyadobacter koreensis]